jgi:hypothetical protein
MLVTARELLVGHVAQIACQPRALTVLPEQALSSRGVDLALRPLRESDLIDHCAEP